MKSKAVISRSYPHLWDFFFNKLGISQAPPFALVDELRTLTERYRNGPVPPEVWEHVAKILADISDAISNVIDNRQNIPGSFEVLAELAAFPVRVPKEGIALRRIDGFYVPDRASKYVGVFRERVPLLDLPDSVPIARIRPLLESDILKDRIRYLDLHVTKKSLPQGRQVLDSETTELYSSRVEYIARYALLAVAAATVREGNTDPTLVIRLLYHNSKKSDFSPDQNKVLAKLHKITVIKVQAIKTTLSLDKCIETTSEEASFEETDDKFTVFVSRTSTPGKSINPPICGALSLLIDVDMMALFTCVTQPVDVIGYFFAIQGIAEIPVDDGHDRSWLQAITQPNVPVIPTTVVVPEKSPSPVPPPSPPPPPPRSPTAVSVHDAEHFPPLGANSTRTTRQAPSPSPSASSFQQSSSNGRQRQRSWAHGSVGVSEHSQFMQSPRTSYNSMSLQPTGPVNALQDMNRLAVQAAAFVNGNQMQMMPGASLAVPVWPPLGNFNVPVSTEETDMIGIMGEHFVRRSLVTYIPSHSRQKNNKITSNPFLKRYTKHSIACWMTLDPRTGRASCATSSRDSRRTEAKPLRTSRTWTGRVSSRGRGSGPRRLQRGMVAGQDIISRSSRRVERRTSHSI